jgi:hypothetical protein
MRSRKFVPREARRLVAAFSFLSLFSIVAASPAIAERPDDCLTGSDTVAVADDVAEIRALRAAIDQACVCSTYDGSEGNSRGDYKRCVLGVVRAAIEAGDLREQCKDTVKGYARESVCGINPARNPVPCARVSPMTGEPKCTIAKLTKADGVTPSGECGDSKYVDRDPCHGASSCIDTADTNLDQIVTDGDSGACPSGYALLAASGKYLTTDLEDGTITATSDDAASVLERFEVVVDGGATRLQAVGTGEYLAVGMDGHVDATADAAAATLWLIFVSDSGEPQQAFILRDGPATSTVDALKVEAGTNRLVLETRSIVDVLGDAGFLFTMNDFRP